ncbi:hypothetical protein ACFL2T_04410 [Elusimicrobiota bacterium]
MKWILIVVIAASFSTASAQVVVQPADPPTTADKCKDRKGSIPALQEDPGLAVFWDMGCEKGNDDMSAVNEAQRMVGCAKGFYRAQTEDKLDEWMRTCKDVNRAIQEMRLERLIKELAADNIHLTRDDISIEKLEQMSRSEGTTTVAAYDFSQDKIIIDEDSAEPFGKGVLAHEWAHMQMAKQGNLRFLTHEWVARAVQRSIGTGDTFTEKEMDVLYSYAWMKAGSDKDAIMAELERMARLLKVERYLPTSLSFSNIGMDAWTIMGGRDPLSYLPGN